MPLSCFAISWNTLLPRQERLTPTRSASEGIPSLALRVGVTILLAEVIGLADKTCRERPPWRSGPSGTPRRAFPTATGARALSGSPYRRPCKTVKEKASPAAPLATVYREGMGEYDGD